MRKKAFTRKLSRLLLLAMLNLTFNISAQAAISTPDTFGHLGVQTSGTSWTWSMTVTSGATMLCVGFGEGGPDNAVSSVKWGGSGGTALTQVAGASGAGGNERRSEIWCLANPTAQTSTVYLAVTTEIGANGNILDAGSWSVHGSSTTVEASDVNHGNSTSATAPMSGLSSGSCYLQVIGGGSAGLGLTLGDSATSDFNDSSPNDYGGAHKLNVSGSVTPSWAVGSGGGQWNMSSMALAPAAGVVRHRVMVIQQ